MKKATIVFTKDGVIMGIFSHMPDAIACKNYYMRRMKDVRIEIETHYIDLFDKNDFEVLEEDYIKGYGE